MEKFLNQFKLSVRISSLTLLPLLIALRFAISTAFNAKEIYEEDQAISKLMQ